MDKTVPSVGATRFYEHVGETVAVRTSGNAVHWIFSDHQGTGELTVESATGQTTRRRLNVFGADRGSTGDWPSDKGFVGGTIDVSTGLIHLGARAYDASIGRFVSVDPVIDFTDSQQMHGYAYANNSPVTFSDPDGLYYDYAADYRRQYKRRRDAAANALKNSKNKARYEAARYSSWTSGLKHNDRVRRDLVVFNRADLVVSRTQQWPPPDHRWL
ncbi:RHS repeat-associated core domain-containing protein [Thermobifida halotolerans]|uniref:RHS repeat-associated core domain-containing protein n=1 Tax=Thermobifida halotolerans TaxID=483545 RepID=A0AA97M5T3_9ACTN|nr:RHS repeat-associated core domain-containing protein [Thermobifida halotolerans]UOE21317.1 RHS repeat-associated core domain-containing protein [Thermobifida halotolerans]